MERKQLIYLVVAAQNGDENAMNELFNAFYNDVYYFALKTVKDPETALDITQETFVTIITTLKELKEPTAFVTWMKQITYSQCTRYFRKKKDILLDEDEDGNTVFDTMEEERGEFIPDKALDEDDFRNTILQMIDDLAPEQRAALLLYYYDELSVKQIAEIQGVSTGTVKSRLNYARKAIKGSVEDYEKRNDVKIHSVAILPLLLWLLQTGDEAVMPAGYVEATAAGISTATGVTVSVGTTTTASTTAAASAVVAAGTGIGAKLAMLPLATKIVAGVTGLLLVAGGVVVATLPKEPPTVPAAVIQTQPSTSKEPVTVPTHPLPTITSPLVTEPPVTDPLPTAPPVTEPPITEPPVTEPPIAEPPATKPPVTDSPVEDPPAERETVPEGCAYIMADGTVLEAGESMPETISDGDELITTDYTYKYGYYYGASSFIDNDIEGWGVRCNAEKEECEPLLSYINGAPLISLRNAFMDNTFLSIAPAIPDTVTDIQQAFSGCTSLTAAPELPVGITAVYATFYGCTALKEAPVIPVGVVDMSYAFYGCSALTAAPVLPDGVTQLYHTFNDCQALITAPDIPNSVTDMEGAFYQCESLLEAPALGKNVKNMDWTFYRCRSLTTVRALPAAVTSMKYTFAHCVALTYVADIPDSVTNLYGTFDGCQALVVAPTLSANAVEITCIFQDCVSLIAAPAIPSAVKDMSFAFAGCTSLTTAPAIPANVTDLDSAFLNCTGLTGTVQIDAVLEDYQLCNGSGCYKCSVQNYVCQSCPTCSTIADCLAGTTNAIILCGNSNKLQEIADTAANGNVTVE